MTSDLVFFVRKQLLPPESAKTLESLGVLVDVGDYPVIVVSESLVQNRIRRLGSHQTPKLVRHIDLFLQLVDAISRDVESRELEEVGDVSVQHHAVRLEFMNHPQEGFDRLPVVVGEVEIRAEDDELGTFLRGGSDQLRRAVAPFDWRVKVLCDQPSDLMAGETQPFPCLGFVQPLCEKLEHAISERVQSAPARWRAVYAASAAVTSAWR